MNQIASDPNLWRLTVDDGITRWDYHSDPRESLRPQNFIERYHLGLEDTFDEQESHDPKSLRTHLEKVLQLSLRLQDQCGCFPSHYDGPLFVAPIYLIALFVTESTLESASTASIIRYLLSVVNDDGGWGLSENEETTLLDTTLIYVACRLHGVPKEHHILKKSLKTIYELGSPLFIPLWGKFILSILGLYSYDGINSVCPELWLLPRWFPLSPGRLWIHARIVMLPMSYLYANRSTIEPTEIIKELRKELYRVNYEDIIWENHKDTISLKDEIVPYSLPLKIVNSIFNLYERFASKSLRSIAVKNIIEYLDFDDSLTEYRNLASVNKSLNMMCYYFENGPNAKHMKQHALGCLSYLWMKRDSKMSFSGTDGSQVWDVIFYTMAFYTVGIDNRYLENVESMVKFLNRHQILHDYKNRKKFYMIDPVGSWPFSTIYQKMPLIDVTSLALSTLSNLKSVPELNDFINEDNLKLAVDFLLRNQSSNGSVASYEPPRLPRFFEKLNSSSKGEIITEIPHIECTSSFIIGLNDYLQRFKVYRKDEINYALDIAVKFLHSQQQSDGSWHAFWGIYFTYSAYFVMQALRRVGENYKNSPVVRKGCDFLIENMHEGGGWSETTEVPRARKYIQAKNPHPVQTSWALIALLEAEYPEKDPLEKSVKLLARMQDPRGNWSEEQICGLFSVTTPIRYPHYLRYFPTMAISKYIKRWGNAMCPT